MENKMNKDERVIGGPLIFINLGCSYIQKTGSTPNSYID